MQSSSYLLLCQSRFNSQLLSSGNTLTPFNSDSIPILITVICRKKKVQKQSFYGQVPVPPPACHRSVSLYPSAVCHLCATQDFPILYMFIGSPMITVSSLSVVGMPSCLIRSSGRRELPYFFKFVTTYPFACDLNRLSLSEWQVVTGNIQPVLSSPLYFR